MESTLDSTFDGISLCEQIDYVALPSERRPNRKSEVGGRRVVSIVSKEHVLPVSYITGATEFRVFTWGSK